jgi:hypothetical protein
MLEVEVALCPKLVGRRWFHVDPAPHTALSVPTRSLERRDHRRPQSLRTPGSAGGEPQVLLNRFDGGNRAQTTPSPGGNGGPWDREMPGESPCASAEHLLPQAVVVGTARLWRGREDGHHRGSIARRGSASEILSDSEGGALAYRKLEKVFARSTAMHTPPPSAMEATRIGFWLGTRGRVPICDCWKRRTRVQCAQVGVRCRRREK